MATLTDEQVDFIARAIRAHGIRLEGLQDNLLDHICILVEQGMEQGGNFEELLAKVFRSCYRENLYELEEEALFLASVKGPRLVLSRTRFFWLLIGVFLLPFVLYFQLAFFHCLPTNFDVMPAVFLRWYLVGSVWPLLSLLVIFFTPERFDPLIPRHAKILLGGGSLIRVFRYEACEVSA
ncbi:hypothetical protein [Puia sp.]|jgi:hypothetical protein|uniref:hypothetical protein n=1 Tax=Puia sp. TaxID=2045100 RepID=UPI002F3EBB25